MVSNFAKRFDLIILRHNRLESGSGYVDIEFTYSHLALGSRGAILQFKAIELT